MPRIYNGVTKNIGPKTNDNFLWFAERIFLQEINDYAAKILIYDNERQQDFVPTVNNRLHLFEKESFGYVKYIPDSNDKLPFKIRNVIKKVYSKRYLCTAYIAQYRPAPGEQIGALSEYLMKTKEENKSAGKVSRAETDEANEILEVKEKKEKEKISLGINEALQEHIEKAIKKATEEGKTDSEIQDITLKAFEEFFSSKQENKTSKQENKQTSPSKESEEDYIRIKKHDQSIEERTRVILELRRNLKDQTLDAVKNGFVWDNKTQKLKKRI